MRTSSSSSLGNDIVGIWGKLKAGVVGVTGVAGVAVAAASAAAETGATGRGP